MAYDSALGPVVVKQEVFIMPQPTKTNISVIFEPLLFFILF